LSRFDNAVSDGLTDYIYNVRSMNDPKVFKLGIEGMILEYPRRDIVSD